MDANSCKLERFSNFSVGMVLLIVGIIFGITSFALLPILGLIIAVPVLILAVIFLSARRSEACALISEKAKRLVS